MPAPKVLPTFDKLIKLRKEQDIFELMFNNVKRSIAFTVENWVLQHSDEHLAYSMLDGQLACGQWGRSVDIFGRRMVLLKTSMGNVVVYERHSNEMLHIYQVRGPQCLMSSPWLGSTSDLVRADLIGLFLLSGAGGEMEAILHTTTQAVKALCKKAA